jgi:hypothetical protein
MKLTKTGTVRLFGNTEYRAQRAQERAWYSLMSALMRAWRRV